MSTTSIGNRADSNTLSLLFMLSGAAGLMYQVSWQRLLFAAFGSDLASVTVIVSAFMAGLGSGALAGGWAADRWPLQTLKLFSVCEIGIGIYGVFSPWLLLGAGSVFVDSPLHTVAMVNFILVLLPALLMGATLPILISHLARVWGNVGQATGQLYAANTFGAGVGAFLPAFVLFAFMPLDHVIYLAAFINVAVALTVILLLGAKKEAV
jgi:predicted membrane-bound spermidine synthase